ncbi:MAG: hypothetical protein GYA33_16920 [Thermogutta sp.]|nr:hypothetical protein [Thermogutta sp.]
MLNLEAIFGDPRDEGMLLRKAPDPVGPDAVATPPDALADWADVPDHLPATAETSGACHTCWSPLAWSHEGERVCPACRGLPPHWGAACRPRPVAPDVVEEIRRIEHAALAQGWSRDELWQNAGWIGRLGLAGVMPTGSKVVGIAPGEIAFRTATGGVMRFRRANGVST